MNIGLHEFSRVSPEARQALFAACTRRAIGNNEVVYLQEDDATQLYFVVSGHVRLSYIMEDGSAVLYAILPQGECFGELGAFDGGTHCDMATGIGTSVISGISVKSFRALCERFPDLDHALARIVAARYRSYIDLTRTLSLKTLSARVAQALLRMADSLGTRTTHNGREVPYVGAVVTQADLGLMARGARGNVNRALKSWEARGWVALKDRAILVLDRQSLDALSYEEDF
jgi:CRP-like cAMP-binding protein